MRRPRAAPFHSSRAWSIIDNYLWLSLFSLARLLEQDVNPLAQSIGVGRLGLELATVDEVCRRGIDADRAAATEPGHHARIRLRPVHVPHESIGIESELARVSDEDRTRILRIAPFGLIAVDHIVHLPEMTLQPGGFGGMCGGHRILMNAGQRELVKD